LNAFDLSSDGIARDEVASQYLSRKVRFFRFHEAAGSEKSSYARFGLSTRPLALINEEDFRTFPQPVESDRC
jgi:hypothetical protein